MKLITKSNLLIAIPILAIITHYLIVLSLNTTEIKLNEFDFISVVLLSIFILIFSFIEELIFRKGLLDALGNTYKSIFINSVIFSIIHIFNAGFFPVALAVTFLISVLLCLIKIYSGFRQCVYIHFLWNWVVAVLLSDNLSGISVSEMLGKDFPFLINSTIFQLSYLDSFWLGSNYGLENGVIVLIILIFGVSIHFNEIRKIGLKNTIKPVIN